MKVNLKDSITTYLLKDIDSENIGKDEKGFLICRNVQIARSGIFKYLGSEIYGEDSEYAKDIILVDRKSSEVFDPKTIASIETAVFTVGHPQEMKVNSDNSAYLTKGWVRNPRKADYQDEDGNDLLLADIIVSDKSAIDKVEKGSKQVSIGYKNDLIQIGDDPKNLVSMNLRINHVALVERGRAGNAFIVDEDTIKDKVIDLDEEGGNAMDKTEFKIKSKGKVYTVVGCDSKEEAVEIAKEIIKAEKKEKE